MPVAHRVQTTSKSGVGVYEAVIAAFSSVTFPLKVEVINLSSRKDLFPMKYGVVVPPFNDVHAGAYNDVNVITLRSQNDINDLATNISTHVDGQISVGTVFLVNEVGFNTSIQPWGDDVVLPVKVVQPANKNGVISTEQFALLDPVEFGKGKVILDTGVEYWSDGVSFSSVKAGYIDFRDYKPTLDGVTDNAALLATAMADAVSANKGLLLPEGKLGISNITVTCPLIGIGNANALSASTHIVPLANDGSICLDLQNYDGFYLKNLRIAASTTVTPRVNSLNTLGLNLGTFGATPVENYACSRGFIDNVKIYGLKQGLFAQGWLNTFTGLYINNCDLGVKLDLQNDSSINLVLENNAKDFEFTNCNNAFFPRVECEGGFGDTASTIDDTKGLTIGSYRTEQPNRTGVPWLKVGFSAAVKNFKILNGSTSSCGFGVEQIEFDNVSNCHVGTTFSTGSDKRKIKTTVNSKNITTEYGKAIVEYTPFAYKMQSVALNLFPDPYLSHVGAGVSRLTIGGGNRAIVSKEVSTIRTGSSAVRITCATGQPSSYISYYLKDTKTIDALKGQDVTLAAWIFVPNLPVFDLATPNTYLPVISLNTRLLGVTVDTTIASISNRFQHNSWNYITIKTGLSLGIDEVLVNIYANNSATLGTGAEFIVVDSIHLATGDDADKNIFEGRVVDSSANPVHVNSDKVVIKMTRADALTASRYINDPLQNFVVGDRVEFTDPIAGDFLGKVCITAGTGTTAVWKDFGAIVA